MEKLRAALYIRVSHEEQVREGLSIETQRENLLNFAKKNNYTIVDIYSDEGVSARKSYKNRKEFMRMIEDVKLNKIDIILFIKLDRYFRNIGDYYKIQEILEKHNVGWKATTENYDTTTANGRLYVNIRLAVAQDEADRTSERIKFVFEKKIQDGEAISGKIPYGYKIEEKKLVIDEEKAKIVRFAYENYLKLNSKREVAILITKKFNKPMTYRTITHTLTNEKYTGKFRNNPNYCPTIIDIETFKKVQEKLKDRATRYTQKTKNEYTYIFTGLMRCPICGNRLIGTKNTYTRKTDGQTTYSFFYRCSRHTYQKSCSYTSSISEKNIENYILENIGYYIKEYNINYDLEQQKKSTPNLKEKKKIENKIKRLQDLYINELIEMEEYKKEYAALKNQLEEFKILPEEKKKDFSSIEKLLNDNFLSVYDKLTAKNKRILWHSIISKIVPKGNTKTFDIFLK